MSMNPRFGAGTRRMLAGALIGASLSMSGCFPIAATGIAVGALAVTDRRTIGTQTEDQGIEVKALSRLNSELGKTDGISVTSFNRRVLLTGQVADEAKKRTAEQVVAKVDTVRTVQNELQVMAPVSFSTSANDTSITARVKTAFVDAKDMQTNTIKVVTENSVVYLMGIVTRAEGDRAAQVASRVSGVSRVVTVFEYVTPDELARIERAVQQEAQQQPPQQK